MVVGAGSTPQANGGGVINLSKGEWQFEAVGKCTMDETISEAAGHYMYKN